PSAYLLVSTEPWASRTARETMFSEAISSISCCWRPSSLPIAAASSGSVWATELVKNCGNSEDDGVLMRKLPRVRRKRFDWTCSYHGAERDSKAGWTMLTA